MLAGISLPQDNRSIWLCFFAIVLASLVSGEFALWRRQAILVFVSGLLINLLGTLAWCLWGPRTVGALVQTNVLCLAVNSVAWTLVGAVHQEGVPSASLRGRPVVFAHLAAQLAVGLLGLIVIVGVTRDLLDAAHYELQLLDWLALIAAAGATAVCLWDRTARFPPAAIYVLGLAALGMSIISRNLSPGRLVVWTGSAELAGFTLVAGIVGWTLQRFQMPFALLRVPHDETRWSVDWFDRTQALLISLAAALAMWISLDFSFDAYGEGYALFGLSGRLAGCPTALMVIGAAIVMAWQSHGARRIAWQYAALAGGVLFTSSLGWAQLDGASEGSTAVAAWLHRSINLMISAAMMTMLARYGLAQVLPQRSDWISRARHAVPVFGSLALFMLVLVLIQSAVLFAMSPTQ